MSFQVPSVFTAIDQVTKPMRVMQGSVNKFSNSSVAAMHRVDRALIGVGRRVNSVTGGFGLLLGSTLAFTAAQASINTMADYEQRLITVGKRAQISGAELTNFGNNAIAISRELNAVVGTEKLLEMAGAAAALGVKGEENLLKFATTLAKLETATNIVGEEGAASIARILNVTGEGVGVVDRFGNAIVALGNNSAATETEILEVANEVARATAPFKLGAAAVLGISASLRSVGVQAQAGGSGVGKFFKRLEEATFTGKNLTEFSKILNLTGGQIRQQFEKDAAGLFLPFVRGLERISNEGGSVNAALQSVGISGEIAFKGLAPLASAADLVANSVKLSNDEFENGQALQKEFTAASRTIKSAMAAVVNEFKNIINETATASNGFGIVSKTLFFLKDNLKFVISAVILLAGAYVTLKAITIGIRVATFAYNVVLGINNVLQGRSLFALKKNIVAMRTHAIVTKLATIKQWNLNAAMSANPIGFIIGLLAVLAVSIKTVANNWDEWGAAVSLSVPPLMLVLSVIKAIEQNWSKVTSAFKRGGLKSAIRTLAVTIFTELSKPFVQLFEMVEKLTGVRFGFLQELKIARKAALDSIAPPAFQQPSPLLRPDTAIPLSAFTLPANPAEPVNFPSLERQLLQNQVETTTNGDINISVRDQQNLLDVQTRDLSDNINVKVDNTFGFTGQE